MISKNSNYKGSVSIYLALTLTIILSLIFTVIESARITSIKSRNEGITFSALDSTFSHFALQLYENYGIFGLFDTKENFIDSVKDYASYNCNPTSITLKYSFNLTRSKIANALCNNMYFLPDKDGVIFASQVVEYEKHRIVSDSLSEIISINDGLNNYERTKPADFSEDTILISKDDLSKLDTQVSNNNNTYKNISKNDAKNLKDDLLTKIQALLKSNLLTLFVKNPSSISSICIDESLLDNFPSQTHILTKLAEDIQKGTAKDSINDIIDKNLFIRYVNNSFSSYQSSINDDISLKYQKEYIIGGTSSDSDNLLATAMCILSFRASLNLSYLISDSDKRTIAENLAKSCCLTLPISTQILTFTILSAWAYGEAIIDVRDLFDNKKVPFFKTDSTWTLSLEDITTLGKYNTSKNNSDSGLDYDDYISSILLLYDNFKLHYRTMDLIQLDICENYNPNFLMSSCIVAADITLTYESHPIFTNIIKLSSPSSYTFASSILYGYD